MYWLRHLKEHGRVHVITTAVYGFDHQEDCTKFALQFSSQHNIVSSKEWANLIDEDGKGGGCPKGRIGRPQTPETKAKISAKTKGRLGTFSNKQHTEKTKHKQRQAKLGKPSKLVGRSQPESTRQLISLAKRGIPGMPHTEFTKSKMRSSKYTKMMTACAEIYACEGYLFATRTECAKHFRTSTVFVDRWLTSGKVVVCTDLQTIQLLFNYKLTYANSLAEHIPPYRLETDLA